MSQNAYRTRHIAIHTIPAHGHVNPWLGLISELVRRGHRVTYAVTGDFVAQVEEAGAVPVLYDSILPSSDKGEAWPEDLPTAMDLFLAEAIEVVPQIEAAYADDRPDLLLYDIPTIAPALGEKWGVPYIHLAPTHVPFEGVEETMGISLEMGEFEARFENFTAGLGVAMTYKQAMAPKRAIVTLPRSFQYAADTVSDAYTFVGPMLTDRAFLGDWTAPDDRPVLVISMGSAYTDALHVYRACIEAFADLDWHVVMSIGRFVDQAELGEIPPNFEVHRWIPQLRVLSQADAFITHAGMGGTMEGLYHGLPMIGIGRMGEQQANAARLEELGLGRQILWEDVTADSLRAAFDFVTTDADTRARLDRMRDEVRRSGGLAKAVEIVEQHL
ncbi:macrolide family glycosyltransferase [Saccharopolyspora taberi]|uniref:Glycosyltransferase n=1 Tax=Saccharopolyspora taberi TaxID=60895 RepID=A0ABN3V6Z4_9PSEU